MIISKSFQFRLMPLLVQLTIGLVGPQAFAWGERGHHTICEVATRLVQTSELSQFLKGRLHQAGHVCNIPDIYWRDMGEEAASGNSTHFLSPENLGYTIETLPVDLNSIYIAKQGLDSESLGHKINVADDLGTEWWRFAQFFNLAVENAREAKAVLPVADSSRALYHEKILAMLVNMGLMGHFIGDASQPFHNTSDYDGWKTNHGGIHSFYETRVVNELPMDLQEKVFLWALDIRKARGTDLEIAAVQRIRKISLEAFGDLATVLQLDPVELASQFEILADGSAKKTPAKRKPLTPEIVQSFEPLVLKEFAIAALALADTWDQIYSLAGKPDLKPYNSYTYPLKPGFVPPTYLPAANGVPAHRSERWERE